MEQKSLVGKFVKVTRKFVKLTEKLISHIDYCFTFQHYILGTQSAKEKFRRRERHKNLLKNVL
jgi:hypothetical protein